MKGKQPAGIGTCDKNGRAIAVGDIVRYMAGSRRDIEQYYLVEDVPTPDIFHAMKPYDKLEDGLYVRLFELDKWGEVINGEPAMIYPKFQQVTQTTIDLKVIQKQLDTIESTLLMMWRHIGRIPSMQAQEQQISEAIDTLLAVKKSFGLTSDLIPVKEQQHATTVKQVMMPVKWMPEERKNNELL